MSANIALKRKQNALKLETTRLIFYFFVGRNNVYVQQNFGSIFFFFAFRVPIKYCWHSRVGSVG